jgi:hypothetical protein
LIVLTSIHAGRKRLLRIAGKTAYCPNPSPIPNRGFLKGGSATNGSHNIHNSHFTMQKADPLLAFSICLARAELPSLTEAMSSAVRALIEGFLDGTLSYPDVHQRAIEQYGIAGFVERIQQILSVPDAPLPDPASVD